MFAPPQPTTPKGRESWLPVKTAEHRCDRSPTIITPFRKTSRATDGKFSLLDDRGRPRQCDL
jgi:hypothetical protein